MTILINIITLILMLGLIILIHELGHFIFAKLFKVHVHEFAIGMGPKIFSKKRKNDETEYTIRALPLGGFNAIAGEEEDVLEDKDVPKNKLFYTKAIWQRAIVLFAGSFFNFILAFLLILIYGLIKSPLEMSNAIYDVRPNSPAYKIGFKAGDKIYSIDGVRTKTSDDVQLRLFIASKRANKKAPRIRVVTERDLSKKYDLIAEKEVVDGKSNYYYGLTFKDKKDKTFFGVFKFAWKKTSATFRQMFTTFSLLFKGELSLKDLSGPVGMYAVVDKSKNMAGFSSLILLTALIAINVGLINLLPVPAFDGGHLLFLLIELIRGKRVNAKFKTFVTNLFFILIIILSVVVLFSDISKLL